MLGHLAIHPRDYGGGDWDSPWKTNAAVLARIPAPLYLDRKVPDSTHWMGSPHPTSVPFLYADNSVKTIDYEVSTANEEQLTRMWIYNREPHVSDLGNQ